MFNKTTKLDDKGKKVYIILYLHTHNPSRSSLLLDSGSDLSLIHESEINKLLTTKEIMRYKTKCTHKVESFSNHTVPILYNITLPWSPHKVGPIIYLTFSVYTQAVAHGLLFGKDNMQKMGMVLSFEKSTPKVMITNPIKTTIESYHAFPQEIKTCSATFSLKPQETKSVIFKPHHLSNIRKGDKLLISESNHTHIHVLPSRYSAYSISSLPLIACVTNLSNEPFQGKISAETEEISDEEIIAHENLDTLPQHLNIYHEAVQTNSACNLPILKLIEPLPSTDEKVTPLTSFLIKTPFETRNNISTETTTPPPLPVTEDPALITELQSIPFQSIPGEPSSPVPAPDFPTELTLPQGYELPCNLPQTVEEILNLDQYEPLHQQYLKEIFIDKFPTVVSLHGYDVGNLSDTMGYYKIQLKDNSPLPVFKKMYYLAPEDKMKMKDILDYLMKYKIIERASHLSDVRHLHACPAFLVPKPDPQSSARLIIDYRLLNEAILTAPAVIPSLPNTLQALRNKYMFSKTDITQAYFSLSIDKESQPLTRFVTDFGSFHMLKLCMGISISPQCWSEITHRMVHMVPKLDKLGNPIFLQNNVVDLRPDHIHGCEVFYDDLIFATELQPTYEETVKVHYALISKVIERLTFHKAKLSLHKSEFGKTNIRFLGWYISHNTLFPDQKRVDKLLNSPFPTNVHGMRSFTGLLNTIRTTLPCTFMHELSLLTPLCSSTKPYQPTKVHKAAFERIKILLTETPIFSRIIQPSAKKILFVDASDKGCYSAVLCQMEQLAPSDTHIPETLSLSDPVDRIIFDHKLCYEPVPLYTLDKLVPKSTLPEFVNRKPVKDISFLNEDFLGYTEGSVKQSLFISIRSIQYAYNCQLSDPTFLKQEAIKKLKASLTNHKILDFQFKNDKTAYNEFLRNFQFNNGPVDDNLYLVELIAIVLNRPFTIISTLEKHSQNKILQFVHDSKKPPFVFGLYKKKDILIFRPYFINKHSSFNLKEIAHKFQIVSFWAKTISEADAKLCIAEKELFAILGALDNFSKLIGSSEILCLTDSRALFLLFSNPVSKSISKLSRWGQKLHQTYPLLKFRFISTKHNMADFLTRNFNISRQDMKRLPLESFEVSNIDNYIDPDKEFTLKEWENFVKDHEHLLSYKQPTKPQKRLSVNTLSRTVKNVQKLLLPMDSLQHKISHSNIATEQQKEFKNIIESCLSNESFFCKQENNEYKLSNGLLYCKDQDIYKILIPPSLEGVLIAYTHLSQAHAGVAKMSTTLFPYTFPQKLAKIKHLCMRCFPCALTNPSTRKQLLGSYPIPNYIYETVVADLAESLPPSQGYHHILIFCCPLTNFITCYPLKSKTASSVAFHFTHGLFQTYRVKYFLSDNGTCFSEKHFLTLLHTLNIQRIHIAALRPESNGRAESAVKQLKYLLKKTLSTYPDSPWTDILPLLVKQINTTVHPNTGFSPLELLHGQNSPSADSPFHQPPPTKFYPLLQNLKTMVKSKTEETNAITEFIKTELQLRKIDVQNRLNKNRISKPFEIGDFVFVKDRSITVGVNPSLRTTYSPDPHIVLQDRPTSLVVQRLSDSFQSVYSKDHVKKYNRLDASFSHLPQPVKDVLINKFEKLDKLHFDELQKHAQLHLPQGFSLNPTISEDPLTSSDLWDQPNIDPTSLIPTPEKDMSVSIPPNTSSNLPNPEITQDQPEDTTNFDDQLHIEKPQPHKPLRSHKYNTRLQAKTTLDTDSSDEEDQSPNKKVTFA